MPHTITAASDNELQRCISLCLDCHATCEATITHCLNLGGVHAELDHITLLRDCAQLCLTSAGFMLRGSENFARTSDACADVCERCAVECERLALHDGVMTHCARVCRECSQACRRMIH